MNNQLSKNELSKKVALYVSRNLSDEGILSDEQMIAEGAKKLDDILRTAAENFGDDARVKATIEAIEKYKNSDELQRNKLFLYCLDFVDPTRHVGSKSSVNSARLFVTQSDNSAKKAPSEKKVDYTEVDHFKVCGPKRRRVVGRSNNLGNIGADNFKISDENNAEKIDENNVAHNVLHAYLESAELLDLSIFIDEHESFDTFGDVVFKIMDDHGLTPAKVYKSVGLKRQDFSRVTHPNCKNVTRKMVWQIAIGLQCSLPEADELLFSAGYVRRKDKLDLTMQYFIEHENYDIDAIDAALSDQGLRTFIC